MSILVFFSSVLLLQYVHGQPACVDKVTCANYGKYICTGIYQPWATDNCAKYCSLCSYLTTKQPVAGCSDLLPDCKDYGQGVCSGTYKGWAIDNCAHYCGLCDEAKKKTTTKASVMTTPKVSAPPVTMPIPGCTDKLTICPEYGKSSCVGKYEGWALQNCPRYCGLCDKLKQQQNKQECTGRDGKKYKQGEVWYYGCDYKCECTDAAKGKSTCHSRCPVWTNLPASCQLGPDPADACCRKPVCATNIFIPGRTVTAPTNVPVATNKCYYKGKYYNQGETWQDGCMWNCECSNAATGNYKCIQRCPVFNKYPSECTLVTDSKDSCCKEPKCPPNLVIKVVKDPNGGVSVFKSNVTRTTCSFNGKEYKKGERWYDGCKYECECDTPEISHYRCRDRCTTYSKVPSVCKMVRDPQDSCCMIPSCPSTGATLRPGVTVPANSCIYKGKTYQTGEQWDDGCKLKCMCTDGSKGAITCRDRCTTYNNVPATCPMIPDPRDSCCTVPQCGSGGNGNTITITPRTECEYKGKKYAIGSKWSDGCYARCQCRKDATYQCEARCPHFSLPKECSMAPVRPGKCCSLPVCPSHIKISIPPNYEE